MADPMKSDEIEDVLSSIRRLVTEHQPHVETASGGDPGGAADRLVLTPALRVTDPEDPWVPIASRDDPSDAAEDLPRGEGGDWAAELWGDEGSGADTDLDPQLQADIWDEAGPGEIAEAEIAAETATAEEGLDTGESLFRPADAADAADAAEVAEGDSDEAAHAASPPPGPSDGDDADLGDDAEAEAPLSFIRSPRSVVDYEPEEGHIAGPDEAPPVATLELAEARAAQMAVSGVLAEIGPDPAEYDADGGPAEDDDRAQGHAPDATPETDAEVDAEAADAGDAPAGGGPDAPGLATSDTAESASEDTDTTDVEDLGESPFTFPDDDVSIVDEDALREIISEVVREELQGEMGKRITRNIRKLVRREIRIALATDELEE